MIDNDWNQLIYDLYNLGDIDRAVRAIELIDESADETRLTDLYNLLDDDIFFIR